MALTWPTRDDAPMALNRPNVPLVHSTLSAVSHGEQVFIAVPGDSIMETVCSRSIASPMK